MYADRDCGTRQPRQPVGLRRGNAWQRFGPRVGGDVLAGTQHLVAESACLARPFDVPRVVGVPVAHLTADLAHHVGRPVYVADACQCFSRVHAHHDTPNNSDNM